MFIILFKVILLYTEGNFFCFASTRDNRLRKGYKKIVMCICQENITKKMTREKHKINGPREGPQNYRILCIMNPEKVLN